MSAIENLSEWTVATGFSAYSRWERDSQSVREMATDLGFSYSDSAKVVRQAKDAAHEAVKNEDFATAEQIGCSVISFRQEYHRSLSTQTSPDSISRRFSRVSPEDLELLLESLFTKCSHKRRNSMFGADRRLNSSLADATVVSDGQYKLFTRNWYETDSVVELYRKAVLLLDSWLPFLYRAERTLETGSAPSLSKPYEENPQINNWLSDFEHVFPDAAGAYDEKLRNGISHGDYYGDENKLHVKPKGSDWMEIPYEELRRDTATLAGEATVCTAIPLIVWTQIVRERASHS